MDEGQVVVDPTLKQLQDELRSHLTGQPNYDQLIEEMGSYAIQIEAEPTFASLANKLAEVQGYRNRVNRMYIDSINYRRKYKRLWEIVRDHQLPVRKERSKELREAVVMNDSREFYDAYKAADDYFSIVRAAYDNLAAANENISRQITAMQAESYLYGKTQVKDQHKPGGETPWGNV